MNRNHLVAVLLIAVPVTADKLIFPGRGAWGCEGMCDVDPVPGATPAPLIPNLIDLVEEVHWQDDKEEIDVDEPAGCRLQRTLMEAFAMSCEPHFSNRLTGLSG